MFLHKSLSRDTVDEETSSGGDDASPFSAAKQLGREKLAALRGRLGQRWTTESNPNFASTALERAQSDTADTASARPRWLSPSRLKSRFRSLRGSKDAVVDRLRKGANKKKDEVVKRWREEEDGAPRFRNREQVVNRLRSLAKQSERRLERVKDEFKMLRRRLGEAAQMGHAEGAPTIVSVEMVQPREPTERSAGFPELVYRAQLSLSIRSREHTWFTETFTLDDLVVVVVKARQAAIENSLCSQVGWCAWRRGLAKNEEPPVMNGADVDHVRPRKSSKSLSAAVRTAAKLGLYLASLLLPILAVKSIAGMLQPWTEVFEELFPEYWFPGADRVVALVLAMQFWLVLASLFAGVTEIAVIPAKAMMQFERKDKLELVREQLEILLNSGDCFNSLDVCNFLSLGMATYDGTSETYKEGRVLCKRHESAETYFMKTHRRRVSLMCCKCEWRFQWQWFFNGGFEERWCVLGKDGLSLFSSIMHRDPTDALFFDTGFSLFRDGEYTLLVCCSSWVLELHFGERSMWRGVGDSKFQYERRQGQILSWSEAITACAQRSSCTKPQRFGSFAPVRHPVHTKMGRSEAFRISLSRYIIGGSATFHKIAEAIVIAKSEIFIAGWWVSPHIELVRDGRSLPGEQDTKLSSLLRSAAKRGVRVYVVLWHDTLLPNDSEWTSSELSGSGIFVVRHRSRFSINLLWSHHEKVVVIDQQLAFVGGLDLCLGRYDDCTHRLSDNPANTWIAQDYSNPRSGDFEDVRNPKREMLDRGKQPRMPWQDVQCMLLGAPAHDLARHCIERFNHAKSKNAMYQSYPAALLRSNLEVYNDRMLPLLEEGEDPNWPPQYGAWQECSAQVIRSVGRWSAGTHNESSIHAAYCDLVQLAERFIYIENQFFSSGLDGDESVGNRVAEALLQRIVLAHKQKQTFHVMIVLPLLPALPEMLAKDPSPLLYIMNFQYRTLRSLRSGLVDAGISFDTYVSVCGLRTHGILKDVGVVTEEVYVHSKVMIVDDRHLIVGSANINDRSLLGLRDSEVCVVIQDTMARQPGSEGQDHTGGVASGLRKALMAQHLSWTREQLEEAGETFPTEAFWSMIQSVAARNTKIYEELFAVVPSNEVRTWSQLAARRSLENSTTDVMRTPSKAEAEEKLPQLQGKLVQFPLDFLVDEDIIPSAAAAAFKFTCWQPDAFN